MRYILKEKVNMLFSGIWNFYKRALQKKTKTTIAITAIILFLGYWKVNSFLNRPLVDTNGARTVTFNADGIYKEGQDIKSGEYYAVVESDSDPSITINLKNGHRYFWDIVYDSKAVKLSVPKNSTIELSEDSSFKLTFYSAEDFKSKNIASKIKEADNEETANSSSVTTTSSSSTSSSSSTTPSSSSTAKSSSSSAIETTADDFYRMQNENTLEVGKTYKFTGKLIDKDSWGYDGEGNYSIYVDAYDSKRGRNEPLILDGTTTIASNIKHANEAEFTVTVSEDSYGDYIFKVVSAQTK